MEQSKTRKVILSMQMTLDGIVASPGAEMDWILAGDDYWQAMFKDLESVDTFLVGRKMYPEYSEYWRHVLSDPAADKNELAFARIADKTPHIVFSGTLTTVDWANTRIAKDAEQEITALKKQPGKDLLAWGGAAFANTLIKLGLIDEYRIGLNPTLLGKGTALFSDLTKREKLKLIDSRPMQSGITLLRYATVR